MDSFPDIGPPEPGKQTGSPGSRRLRQVLPVAALAAALAACAAPATAPAPDDPLVGRVFRSAGEHELTPGALLDLAAEAGVVYLGEKHDNPRHHELQLDVLRGLVERGLEPAIGFEVFPTHRTSLLLSYTLGEDRPGGEPAEARLRRRLGWDGAQGNESWAFYGPLLELARHHRLTVFGADLPVPLRARMIRVGVDGLSPVERGLLRPTGFTDHAYEALMREKLKAAHCGFGSAEYLGRLYGVWVARNDVMATAVAGVRRAHAGGPVVVILGAGHTEHDMGVHERVAHLVPGVRQLNLAFREVGARREPLAAYTTPRRFAGRAFPPRHAYLWFTGRAGAPGEAEDRCAAFRKRATG